MRELSGWVDDDQYGPSIFLILNHVVKSKMGLFQIWSQKCSMATTSNPMGNLRLTIGNFKVDLRSGKKRK